MKNFLFISAVFSCLCSCQTDHSSKLVGLWEGKRLILNEDTLHFSSTQRHPQFQFDDTTFVLINRFGIKQEGTYILEGEYLKFKNISDSLEVINKVIWYNDDEVIELIMKIEDQEQRLFLQRQKDEQEHHHEH